MRFFSRRARKFLNQAKAKTHISGKLPPRENKPLHSMVGVLLLGGKINMLNLQSDGAHCEIFLYINRYSYI